MQYRNKFWYGSSYSPLIFPENDWDRDLQLMAKAGMNIIRIGDVHGSWDRIEPQEGKFQFDQLERFYKKAMNHGISIMISTGSASPPLWLALEFSDLPILSNKNIRYPLGSSYGWACIHHPDYLAALKNYLTALVQFAQKQPNHFGWQISNEIGFPFLPSRGGNELDIFCYCDYCQSAFRIWTREKYGSLDALNQAWNWGTASFIHNDWNDVFPPEGLPGGWSSPSKWIDWRIFWQDEFSRFAEWQHHIIKQIDPEHPTSVNTFNFKGYDRFGTLMGLDQWKISKQVDHIGYDLYPGSGNKLAARPEHNSIFLDHGKSVAQYANTDFWLHEIESGPIGGWVMGPDHHTSELDILRNGFEAIGHDVKLMMYMPWKEWDYQPLHWGALVDLDGKETSRLSAASSIGKFIKDNENLLLSVHPAASEVAILESKENAIFFQGIGQEENIFQAQRGAYRAFWDLGYSVDFIIPDQLEQAVGKYQIILLPMMGLVSTASANALNKFVCEGGILFGFSRCGTLSEKGWYNHVVPPAPLQEVFGIESCEPDLLNQRQIQYKGQTFNGLWNCDRLTVTNDTDILASFDDGLPAATVHSHHIGKGIYLATHCDAAYVLSQDKFLQTIITNLNLPTPAITLDYSQKSWRDIDVHLLMNQSEGMILFTNYRKKPEKVKVTIHLPHLSITEISQIFPDQKTISPTSEKNEFEFNLGFEGEEVKAVHFSL